MSPSLRERYIVDQKGNPTAVILPIGEYRKILSRMDELEDRKESSFLSQSPEFQALVMRGLEDIKKGRTTPWKEVWDEI